MLMTASCSMDSLLFWQDDEPVAAEKGGKKGGKSGEAAAPAAAAAAAEAAGQGGEDAAATPASSGRKENSDSQEETAKEEKKPEPQMERYVSRNSGKSSLEWSKVMARLDELEGQLRRQREDFHVLKKGLMTGLIPREWQENHADMGAKVVEEDYSRAPSKSDTLSVMLGEGSSSLGAGKASSRDLKKYEKKAARASQHFKAGDYGKAILSYTEIGRDYSDKVTKGSHHLWIGASWYRLKDYEASRKHLAKLISGYKQSPWVPEAYFLMAKADFREGYVERSMERLKEIIQKYPRKNIADRARQELKRVEENL